MNAYDGMLTAMQEMVTETYHVSKSYYDKDYVFPVDEVHERLSVHLRAVLAEISERLETLAMRELVQDCTAADRMRSLAWSIASEEIEMFAEGNFVFEPLETRVPDEDASALDVIEVAQRLLDRVDELKREASVKLMAEEISERFARLDESTLTPDYVYDPLTGTVVPLSARAKYAQQPSEGYRHTQRYIGTLTDPEVVTAADRARAERVVFGENVYARRKELGAKRKALAYTIGENKKTIKAIEYGEYEFDHTGERLTRESDIVIGIAWGLGTTVDVLWPTDSHE